MSILAILAIIVLCIAAWPVVYAAFALAVGLLVAAFRLLPWIALAAIGLIII